MDWKVSVVITEEYNVTANSEELIGITEYLTLWTRCRINRCRYNRVRLLLCWRPFSIMLMIYEAQCDELNHFVPYVVQYAMFVVKIYGNYRTWIFHYDLHAVLKANWIIKILKAPLCKCLCTLSILQKFICIQEDYKLGAGLKRVTRFHLLQYST